MKKRIAILGATGSIGSSTLDLISRNKDIFDVVLLSSNHTKLDKLSCQYPNAICVQTGEKDGQEKLLSAVKNANACLTINGISGAAGLKPSLAALESGSNLALANKETIVMAGELALRTAEMNKVKIIPVDSEHSAIFHLLKNYDSDLVSEIILTASGGAFRDLSIDKMQNVTLKDALSHPTWKMGPKITIDSASMANKGLEIIEACVLFNLPPEKIKVVIHPQSIVHSMIHLCNGVFYAQLSKPDMRHPIHDALFWPDTVPSSLEPINFDSLTLDFYKPDFNKYPMLNLAWNAVKLSGFYPCVYNAANEEAVAAFIGHKIGFMDIPAVTASVLDADWSSKNPGLDEILKADAEARQKALGFISLQT